MQYFILILGLAMIVKSADILIDSSSKIAKRYGAPSVISPIPADGSLWVDAAVMLILTALVFIISWFRKTIKRRAGIILLLSYVLYLIYKVISAI